MDTTDVYISNTANEELMDGAPPESVCALEYQWLNETVSFLPMVWSLLARVKPSGVDPAIMILNNHLWHTQYVSLILKESENYAVIIFLPFHGFGINVSPQRLSQPRMTKVDEQSFPFSHYKHFCRGLL